MDDEEDDKEDDQFGFEYDLQEAGFYEWLLRQICGSSREECIARDADYLLSLQKHEAGSVNVGLN